VACRLQRVGLDSIPKTTMLSKDTKNTRGAERPAPPSEAGAAEAILKALVKLVNGRKIYAANNPRLEQFRDEFESALHRWFERADDLVLTIEQFAIKVGEDVVYENASRDESLAFILFKDGIGEITLLPRAVGAETDALVRILADELYGTASDEDVVTRFWNADFESITYRVLDDYLAGEFGAGGADAAAGRCEETSDHAELLPSLADKGRVVVDRSEALVSIDTYLRGVVENHHPGADPREQEAAYQRLLRSAFGVPAEETALYTAELDRERAEDGIAAFVESVLVFTLLSDNPSAVRDVYSIVERLVEYAATERRIPTLMRLARHLREFSAREGVPDPVRRFCEKQRARVTSPALATEFLDAVATGAAPDEALAYAIEVGPAAIDPLVRVLHRCDDAFTHRRLCDTLITVAGDSLPAVLHRLDVDHPEVALDAVYMARRAGLPALSPRIRQLAFYPDARVKLEMLQWVSARNDADSTDVLLSSLADLDKRVRLKVLEVLAERPEPRVRATLTELAFEKDLGERAADEQDALFRALGRVGDANTAAQLRTFVEKRKLGLGRSHEHKLLALRALEHIRSEAALELITRLCDDGNEPVRLRAQRAREALTALLRGEPAVTGARAEARP